MKNKLITLTLSIAMLLSLTACGNSEQPQETDTKIKIGVLQLMEHESLDQAREGYLKALEDAGYTEDKIVVDIQNGQNDPSNLSTMSTHLINEDSDIILAIGTGAAQALATKTTEVPILFTAVTDPLDAGLVVSNEAPGGNISGTNDASPMKEQLELLIEVSEKDAVVGFIYSSSEDNSILQINQAKAILDEIGVAYTEKTVTSTNDVQQAMISLAKECQAIYVPTDNTLASSMPIVGDVAKENKIPVVCGANGMVTDGGLVTLGLSYYNLGYQTGEMAVRILEGADISTMPVESLTKFEYAINQEMVDALGVTLPSEITK